MGAPRVTDSQLGELVDILALHQPCHAADAARHLPAPWTEQSTGWRLKHLAERQLALRDDKKLWWLTPRGQTWAIERKAHSGSPWCIFCNGSGVAHDNGPCVCEAGQRLPPQDVTDGPLRGTLSLDSAKALAVPEREPWDIPVAELGLPDYMLAREDRPAPLTGGRTNYYLVQVLYPQREEQPPYQAECEDIISAIGMTFDEACIFKALWRSANARNGNGKPGGDAIYDAEKMVRYAQRVLLHRKRSS